MTFEQKGAYIELLMLQFNRGHMTKDMIGHTVGQLWDTIKDKFVQDDKGLWFNERLDLEKFKRKRYTESRRNNIKGKNQHSKDRGHTTSRMEDRDINEDSSIIINKDNIDELKNCFTMKEYVCKLIGKPLSKVESLLNLFIIEQEAKGELNRSLKDLRRHFTSWAKLNHDKVQKRGISVSN